MKLKAVISPNLPVRLARALIAPKLNTWYQVEIAKGCLHCESTNPAGHYIQWPDFSVEWEDGQCGIEVSFSKLSASFSRSGKDFENARGKIEEKFIEIMKANMPVGRDCWLFVGSQTDKPQEGPKGEYSTLIERGYVLVKGEATPDPEQDVPAGEFSLKPLRGPLHPQK